MPAMENEANTVIQECAQILALVQEMKRDLQEVKGSTQHNEGRIRYIERRDCWKFDYSSIMERELKVEQVKYEANLLMLQWNMKQENVLREPWFEEKWTTGDPICKQLRNGGYKKKDVYEHFKEANQREWLHRYAENAAINAEKQTQIHETAVCVTVALKHPEAEAVQSACAQQKLEMQKQHAVLAANMMAAKSMELRMKTPKMQGEWYLEEVRKMTKEFSAYASKVKPVILRSQPIVVEIHHGGLRSENAAQMAKYAADPAEPEAKKTKKEAKASCSDEVHEEEWEDSEEQEEITYGRQSIHCRTKQQLMKALGKKHGVQHYDQDVKAVQIGLLKDLKRSPHYVQAKERLERDLGALCEVEHLLEDI